MIVTSIYWWYSHMQGVQTFMLTNHWSSNPWQLITYPFAYTPLADALAFMFFVCLIAWMVFAGMTVEREIGSLRFAILWLLMSLIPALLVGIYASVGGSALGFGGPFLPAAGLTVAWCTRYAKDTILLYGFIPMSGKWVAWITAAMVFFLYGAMRPEYGILAAGPLVLAWLYAANRLPIPYGRVGGFGDGLGRSGRTHKENLKRTERMDRAYYDDVKRREQERAEREKLRKLFESSMDDDKDK